MANSGSTSSSLTSTSHTMTAFPHPTTNTASSSSLLANNSPIATLIDALAPTNRYAFITPQRHIPEASLGYAKEILDTFAGKLADEQAEQLKEQRKKRKRGDAGPSSGEVLKIRKIYTEGFDVEQVWQQARRVINALRADAAKTLDTFDVATAEDAVLPNQLEDRELDLMKFDEDGFEISTDENEAEGENVVVDDRSSEADYVSPDNGELEVSNVDIHPEVAYENGGDDDLEDEEREDSIGRSRNVYVSDPNGLNDGFFSIEAFNKQTEFLEQQDASADPFTVEDSDEEEIDWEADPLSLPMKTVAEVRSAAAMENYDEEEESGDEEEDVDDADDGPTFGHMDLNAPEGESEEDEDPELNQDIDAGGENANDVFYKDFFEPPARKASKGERESDYLKRQARKPKALEPEDNEAEMERAIADVRRDLFDEESDLGHSEDALSEVDPADPKSRKSAHERRQIKLGEEIRRLEAASVAKREWALAGEARATDRPLNSLLDQDLDFERTGKPVLEVTAEVSENIEELIKRRILAQEFDEVIRRRPDDLAASSATRRGAFILDNSKPQQSLAELYEEDHVKATNPDTYVSKADEKALKEEKEIEVMWKEVSAKLDALSSWHYKPKPAAPSLTVIADVATVAMEDAQPTTASGISGGESMLAPQEIYKAGREKHALDKTEVVTKGGAPIARQEMTREEKLRRRRREKERIKKRGGEGGGGGGAQSVQRRPESKKSRQKKETVGDLKKGGVKVIDRKGDVRDVNGNKVQAASMVSGAGGFKL